MHYVLARNKVPEGSPFEIEKILRRESPDVKSIFDKHRIPVRAFVPSEDYSRFAGIDEDVPISPIILEMMKRELNKVGYRLKGPFESKESADRYWQTGVPDYEPNSYRI